MGHEIDNSGFWEAVERQRRQRTLPRYNSSMLGARMSDVYAQQARETAQRVCRAYNQHAAALKLPQTMANERLLPFLDECRPLSDS
jgi:3-dehydroquinate dehydratase